MHDHLFLFWPNPVSSDSIKQLKGFLVVVFLHSFCYVLVPICFRPRTVSRKILCHTIVGRKGAKTLIRAINCTIEFIAPLIYFSSRKLLYRIEKVSTNISNCSLILCLCCQCLRFTIDFRGILTSHPLITVTGQIFKTWTGN